MRRELDLHDIQSFVMRGHGKDYCVGRHYLLEIASANGLQIEPIAAENSQASLVANNDDADQQIDRNGSNNQHHGAQSQTGKSSEALVVFLEWLRDQVTTAAPWKTGKPDSIINVAFTYEGLAACGVPVMTLSGFPSEFREGMRERRQLLGDSHDYDKWDDAWKPGIKGGTVHLLLIHMARYDASHGDYNAEQQRVRDRLDAFHRQLQSRGKRAGLKILQHPHQHEGEDHLDWLPVGQWPEPPSANNADQPLISGLQREHFGFADGLSDPIFDGQDGDHIDLHVVGRGKRSRDGNWLPLATGEFLLGYPDEAQEQPPAPRPYDFSRNCTFMVYRKLNQNIEVFEQYIDKAAQQYVNYLQQAPDIGQPAVSGEPLNSQKRNDAAESEPKIINNLQDQAITLLQARETLKAKMMGRWPDGTPLVVAPDWASWQERQDKIKKARETGDATALNRYRQELVDFTYLETDRDGQRCPLGSHIRRTNPRDSLDPTPPITAASNQQSGKETGSLTLASADQTSSTVINNRRRILRRGTIYGTRETSEHGLIFIALCASLFRQFEFVQQQWVQYGRDFEAGSDTCPISGQRLQPELNPDDPIGDKFVLPTQQGVEREPFVCTRLQPFVNCHGGAYFYVPSLTCLRLIAQRLTDAT